MTNAPDKTKTRGRKPQPEGLSRSDRLEGLYKSLSEAVPEHLETEQWTRFLDFQARMPHYSFRNNLLLQKQNPQATRVASFAKWKDLDRVVDKGEKAMWVLGPARYKMLETDEKTGEEQEKQVVKGFVPVPVFDVSQTSGEPLPEPTRRLQGDAPEQLQESLVMQIEEQGFSFAREEWKEASNGWTSFDSKQVAVRSDLSPAHTAKTTAHELGHILMNHGQRDLPREQAELEAESFAYVVCHEAGLDAGEYSFGYLASWTANEDAEKLFLEAGSRVCSAARSSIGKNIEYTELMELAAGPTPEIAVEAPPQEIAANPSMAF